MPYDTDISVRLPLSPEEHRKLRMLAAAEDSSMSQIAKRVVTRYINQQPIYRPVENPNRGTKK
jgi:hypothetical protein